MVAARSSGDATLPVIGSWFDEAWWLNLQYEGSEVLLYQLTRLAVELFDAFQGACIPVKLSSPS